MSETKLPDSCVEADGLTIDLKNRYLAAILAFLFPGAGHFYQGRSNKAGCFCTCILGLFVIGMILSGGKCVYASWGGGDYRWHYILQAGIGLPAAPAAIQWYYREEGNRKEQGLPILKRWMSAPRMSRDELNTWHRETSAGFDLGTLYTMVAGLLNILVVFDAFGGPLPLPSHDKQSKKPEPDAPA
jgi:hypothetical protein